MAADTGKHVMLSYQWGSQATVLRIKEELEKRGFDVWMDVDDMTGNINEAMAQGVEGAAVVVSCVSEAYKNSHNCQKELTFADVRRKAIIPLKMESGVVFDGWLGVIMAGKLWINFSDEAKFDERIEQLVVELVANEVPSNLLADSDEPSKDELLSFGVDEVCQWLKRLDIKDSVLNTFTKNCVNGDDLSILTEEILVSDQFKVEPFIASKIIRNRNKALEKESSAVRPSDETPQTKKSIPPFVPKITPVKAKVVSKGRKGDSRYEAKEIGKSGKGPAEFNHPFGLAWTPNNILLVADQFNHRVQFLNADFECVDEMTFKGQFSKPFQPYDIAVSKDNIYFITDCGNNQVIVTDESKKIIRVMCQNEGELYGITLLGDYVIVTDCSGNRVLKFTQLGDKVGEIKGDLKYPYSVVALNDDRVAVADSKNNRIQVYTSDLEPMFSYGSKGSGYGELLGPWGIAADSKNNLYMSDGNGRVLKLTDDRQFEVLYTGIKYACYLVVHEGPPFTIAVAQGNQDKITVLTYNTK